MSNMDIGTLPTGGCQSLMRGPEMATMQYFKWGLKLLFQADRKAGLSLSTQQNFAATVIRLMSKPRKRGSKWADLTAGIEQARPAGAGEMLVRGSKAYYSPPI
jgi:hypothetical protein